MRQLDEFPLDPEIAAQLNAIDATLAGEPVDPEYAELAELALLVTVARPQVSAEFAAELDDRVQRRFAPASPSTAAGSATKPRKRRRSIRLWPAAGACATALAGVVAVVVVVSNMKSTSSSSSSSSGATASAPAVAVQHAAASTASSGSAASTSSAAGAVPSTKAPAPTNPALTGPTGAASRTPSLQPPPNGRKVVQSAQLQLTTPPARIDQVAQEAFNVIGLEHGVVNHSTVTATGGQDGYGDFQLSVPSANLADAMTRLSSLRYANIASRTDVSQDVNNQYVSDVRRLADAKALRTSLLKQLAHAVTQAQIDSLNAQIHDAESSISSAESTLGSLKHQIGSSQIELTINAGAVPIAHAAHSSGFTIGKAAHDAGRVLTVAAGVALIALAALVPVGLVVALALWIGLTLRRRRREQALDAA